MIYGWGSSPSGGQAGPRPAISNQLRAARDRVIVFWSRDRPRPARWRSPRDRGPPEPASLHRPRQMHRPLLRYIVSMLPWAPVSSGSPRQAKQAWHDKLADGGREARKEAPNRSDLAALARLPQFRLAGLPSSRARSLRPPSRLGELALRDEVARRLERQVVHALPVGPIAPVRTSTVSCGTMSAEPGSRAGGCCPGKSRAPGSDSDQCSVSTAPGTRCR